MQPRLHRAQQIIGDTVGGQDIAGKSDVHRIDGFADFYREHRALRLRRQLVEHRIHLGVDLCQGLVWVEIEAQVGGYRADTVLAGRGDVVDAVGLGDDVFQWGRDKADDSVGIGAVVGGRDRDDGVFSAWILQHWQAGQGAQAQYQQYHADNGGQNRTANKNIG